MRNIEPRTWAEHDYARDNDEKSRTVAYADNVAGLVIVTFDPDHWGAWDARGVASGHCPRGIRPRLVKTERVTVGGRLAEQRTYTVDGLPL